MSVKNKATALFKLRPTITAEELANDLDITLTKAASVLEELQNDPEAAPDDIQERADLEYQVAREENDKDEQQVREKHWRNLLNKLEAKKNHLTGRDKHYPTVLEIPITRGAKSESIPVLMNSDLIYGIAFKKEQTQGHNEFNPTICIQRQQTVYRQFVRSIQQRRQASTIIQTAVIWLGGNFIAAKYGEINDNQVLTVEKQLTDMEDLLSSSIAFVLKNARLKKLVIVCSAGSADSQITNKQRVPKGNDFEWALYTKLAQNFKADPRVVFHTPHGQHAQIRIFGKLIRMSHGDGIVYREGVGGLTIPVMKKVNAWNGGENQEDACLDLIAHWQTYMPNRRFIVNGSLTGYSPRLAARGVSPAPPIQATFCMEKNHGLTSYKPIYA